LRGVTPVSAGTDTIGNGQDDPVRCLMRLGQLRGAKVFIDGFAAGTAGKAYV